LVLPSLELSRQRENLGLAADCPSAAPLAVLAAKRLARARVVSADRACRAYKPAPFWARWKRRHRRVRRKVGPYSRTLRRGVIGTSALDGRSTAGRYVRDLEAQLVAHCGGAPTITQRLLIERLIRTTVQLNTLDVAAAAGGGWTDHDSRTHGGLINRQRLLLRELGLKGAAEAPPSLGDVAGRIIAARDEAAA
jgi:hypothetical protein